MVKITLSLLVTALALPTAFAWAGDRNHPYVPHHAPEGVSHPPHPAYTEAPAANPSFIPGQGWPHNKEWKGGKWQDKGNYGDYKKGKHGGKKGKAYHA